ncbi:MAG: hypothetical protein ACYC7H_12305, partial [Chloroflexota bacterium]
VDFTAGTVVGQGRSQGDLAWTATFPPKDMPVVVKDGWQAVAADGVSELQIEATVPEAWQATEVSFLVTKVTKDPEDKAEPGMLSSFWGKSDEAKKDEKPQGEAPKDAKLVVKKIDNHKAIVAYKPPKSVLRPFEVEITATATDDKGRALTGKVTFKVVNPPVALIHGVWSSKSEGWSGAIPGLKRAGFDCIVGYDYGDRNNGDPTVIAKSLAGWLKGGSGPLQSAANGTCEAKAPKTLVARYDVVAHSLGGLITRRAIADGSYQGIRRVVTLGTPHQGSDFADWFVYFQRGKKDPSISPPPIVANHPGFKADPNWDATVFDPRLKTMVSGALFLNDRFFADGPAVDALRPNSKFLKDLNAADAHADTIEYYFIAGTNAFVNPGLKKQLQDGVRKKADPKQTPDASQRISPTDAYVYETFYEYVGMDHTDGVVSESSAKGTGLSFKITSDTYAATHVTITQLAIPIVANYLRGGSGGSGGDPGGSASFTSGTLMSPAHLHAYDDQGRHVGLGADGKAELGIPGAYFVGPEESTGVPETIYVPGDVAVRFEVRGYKEGQFGLVVRKQTASSNSEVRFADVPIKSGETARLQPNGKTYTELQTATGAVRPQATVDLSRPAGGVGTTGSAGTAGGASSVPQSGEFEISWLLLAVGVVAGGGITFGLVRARRTPQAPAGAASPRPASYPQPLTEDRVPPAATPSLAVTTEQAPAAHFCIQCGRELPAGSRFCLTCGTAVPGSGVAVTQGLPVAQASVEAGPATKRDGGRNGLYSVLGFLCLPLGLALPVLWLGALGFAIVLWRGGARKRAVLLACLTVFVLPALYALALAAGS